MPYRETPVVRDHHLWQQATAPLAVGTAAWFRWLDQADHFCYMSSHSSYRLTLRKEKRRNGWYWYAYLKVDRKLHNAYLGRSQALTEEKLAWALQHLLTKVHNTKQTASEKKKRTA
jgi:hypothetical protein